MGTLPHQLPKAKRGNGPRVVVCRKVPRNRAAPPPRPPSLAGKDRARRRKTVYFSTQSGTGRFSQERSLASL